MFVGTWSRTSACPPTRSSTLRPILVPLPRPRRLSGRLTYLDPRTFFLGVYTSPTSRGRVYTDRDEGRRHFLGRPAGLSRPPIEGVGTSAQGVSGPSPRDVEDGGGRTTRLDLGVRPDLGRGLRLGLRRGSGIRLRWTEGRLGRKRVEALTREPWNVGQDSGPLRGRSRLRDGPVQSPSPWRQAPLFIGTVPVCEEGSCLRPAPPPRDLPWSDYSDPSGVPVRVTGGGVGGAPPRRGPVESTGPPESPQVLRLPVTLVRTSSRLGSPGPSSRLEVVGVTRSPRTGNHLSL